MQKAYQAKLGTYEPSAPGRRHLENRDMTPKFLPVLQLPALPSLYHPSAPNIGVTDSFPKYYGSPAPVFALFAPLLSPPNFLPIFQNRCPLLQEAFPDHTPFPIRGPHVSFSPDHPKMSLTISGSSPALSPPPSTLTLSSRSWKGQPTSESPSAPHRQRYRYGSLCKG